MIACAGKLHNSFALGYHLYNMQLYEAQPNECTNLSLVLYISETGHSPLIGECAVSHRHMNEPRQKVTMVPMHATCPLSANHRQQSIPKHETLNIKQ